MKKEYYFDNALRALAGHNNQGALKWLKKALDACPSTSFNELEKILYYTGLTLMKLGGRDAAVRFLVISSKINKKGYSSRITKRLCNEYGQTKGMKDDWKAFYSIQLSRYLAEKKRHVIRSRPEKDMINDLIYDRWKDIVDTEDLKNMTTNEKKRIFRSVKIYFPHLFVPAQENEVFFINFREKRETEPLESCPCGSGLPFSLCCGRLLSIDELESGYF